MVQLEIKSSFKGTLIRENTGAITPENVIGEEPCSFRVIRFQVFLMSSPVSVSLLLVVRNRVVIHSNCSESCMCSVFEFRNPLVFTIICSNQLHCNLDGKSPNKIKR